MGAKKDYRSKDQTMKRMEEDQKNGENKAMSHCRRKRERLKE